MIYASYMTDELTKLAAPKKKKGTPWYHLTTPGQAKRFGKFTEKAIKRPFHTLKKVPKFIGRSTVQGVKAGLKGKGIMPKLWTGVLAADPILTTRSALKSKQMTGAEKGKSIGESVGGSIGFLAAHRAPFLGSIGASIAGSVVGSRIGKGIGSLLSKKPKTPQPEG